MESLFLIPMQLSKHLYATRGVYCVIVKLMKKVIVKQNKKQKPVRRIRKKVSRVKKSEEEAVKFVAKSNTRKRPIIRKPVGKNPYWLKPYLFKKGQSGNPKGRPPEVRSF